MDKQELHKIEMDLVNLCEDNEIIKEAIINHFTNLMSEGELEPDFKKAYNILMDYWDSIADEEKPKVDKRLKACGL